MTKREIALEVIAFCVLLEIGSVAIYVTAALLSHNTFYFILCALLAFVFLLILWVPRKLTPVKWQVDHAFRRKVICLFSLVAMLFCSARILHDEIVTARTGLMMLFFGPLALTGLAARWWLPETSSIIERFTALALPFLFYFFAKVMWHWVFWN